MNEKTLKILIRMATFFDVRRVGHVGPLGFRRSTDLMKLMACMDLLLDAGIIIPGKTRFLDLGCADGRVNVFLSPVVKVSAGIELDEWTLDEYSPLKAELDSFLEREGLSVPSEDPCLVHGDAMDESIHDILYRKSGVSVSDFDVFYTYLVMHEEFSQMIAKKGRTGAYLLVFGLSHILPRLEGFRLLDEISPVQGTLGIYQKE